ncbi:hypothetical protein NFI96_008638 [Prochilodus magdalenae]|nr:hypothetical protein NFI96_008638 [Prochilodus magdalenae]
MDYSLDLYTYRVSYMVSGAERMVSECRYKEVDLMKCYLLPHLLPPKPAMDIHGFRQQSSNTIQRHFKMSFVPAGFWERFIARMLISLNQMDLQAFESKRGTRSPRNRSAVIYSFAGSQQRNRCSTFRVRRSQTIYWKEGLLVTFDGGYLRFRSLRSC